MKGRGCFDGAVSGGRVESGLEMGAGCTVVAISAACNTNFCACICLMNLKLPVSSFGKPCFFLELYTRIGCM